MKSRILIVEDESIVALDIQTRLEAHGFDVIDIVSTGSRAIDCALNENPDLILMDINLKGSIDGIETASLIKRQLDSPIIFLTAFADEKTLKKARISDASGYILKPFRESELLITIELAIKRASVRTRIQENSNWLYSTLNNMNDAVITVSDEKRIIFLNDKARSILGDKLSAGDVFDLELFITINGQRTFFKHNENIFDIEYTQTDIRDDDGEILGKVHFIHDITKQVEYEIGLENARVAAENSNRAKNDFLSNVTHELRTPLNTIIGMNSLISEISEDDEITTMHNLINLASETLLKQLNEILELSEIENGKFKIVRNRFSIDEMIRKLINSFEVQINLKSLDVYIFPETSLPLLIGDKNKIRDILSCLISNAVKFTKKGKINISSSLENKNLVVSVEDSGIGLSEEQKISIFQLFTQIDGSHTRMFGGIGIGLTLVRNLTELLNGTIEVDSDSSSGSKFTVTLPIEISTDQKRIIEEDEDRESIGNQFPVNKKSMSYKDLVLLLNEIKILLEDENYSEIEKKIKLYTNKYKISDLNFESQILFSISIALKLKNVSRFHVIMDKILNESVKTAGGINENTHS